MSVGPPKWCANDDLTVVEEVFHYALHVAPAVLAGFKAAVMHSALRAVLSTCRINSTAFIVQLTLLYLRQYARALYPPLRTRIGALVDQGALAFEARYVNPVIRDAALAQVVK